MVGACGFVTSFLGASAPLRGSSVGCTTRRAERLAAPLTMLSAQPSKRELRRAIIKSENFNRLGFPDTKEEVEGMMTSAFTSTLIDELRQSAYEIQRGDVTVRLAKAFGFCWGVERAVAMAFETRKQYPGRRIHVTNEIIHNQIVNKGLEDMGIFFVPTDGSKKDFSAIESGDVVILPAFGATLQEMQTLNDRGCLIVDTTCPWVAKVWGALDKHKRASCTSVIHGKWNHEETIATASFADTYLVVRDIEEAEYVAEYILNGGDRANFLEKFKNAMSAGFDPDSDLEAVGIANQTTMMMSETYAIGKLFERTMMRKYGTAELSKRFVAYDTICDATQERQDAVSDLLNKKDELDFIVIVGGFNSSNTSHLQEMGELAGIKSYWVNAPSCIGPGNSIVYRTSDGREHTEENWLPDRPITIGLTGGASTPDKVIGDVVENIFMVHKIHAASREKLMEESTP